MSKELTKARKGKEETLETMEVQQIETLNELNRHIDSLLSLVGKRIDYLTDEDLLDLSLPAVVKLIESLAKASGSVADSVKKLREKTNQTTENHLHIERGALHELSDAELMKLLAGGE